MVNVPKQSMAQHTVAGQLVHVAGGLVHAVIPAAGSGSRMGLDRNKVFLPLRSPDETVLSETIRNIAASGVCGGVTIVVRETDKDPMQGLLKAFEDEAFPLPIAIVPGGRTRQESVKNGLLSLKDINPSWVLVHDGARPFCSPEMIRKVVEVAQEQGAAILATPAKNTLKCSQDGMQIERTIPRDEIWEAQTPQVFPYSKLLRAHLEAAESGFEGTDDSQLFERMGEAVWLVPGEDRNVKITSPVDLAVAQVILEESASTR